ncbi:chromate efflux transporter [Nocardioides sp. YIM 152315]|uniref:chromate efflux transporter n=1 Tax=Nocardioides sp. YIM 152315 TaxID=3031760 RepID=UPI0023DA511C|nr:chromate efflux transporter [Nocardioides sp. YIM 152315]MDF1606386.1 chromate efflux transporter [Nocardioides sp. YIM 152315]
MLPPTGKGREVALVFLRLGTIAFGGPVAHVAMMREEVVRRRGWVSDERFVDLMSATNLIPGPNSTELAIHLGWDRARWRGLLAAGVCFILPAAVVVTALAWLYVEHGETPGAEWVLHGVVPAVLAIVAWALVGLLPVAVRNRWLGLLAAGALTAYLLGVNELAVLVAGAGVAAAAHVFARRRPGAGALLTPLAVLFPDPTAAQLAQLFLTFLKIGSVLYGSGYVLLAFLEGDLVGRLGWVTQQQLVDAVSIGQVTPGPVFTTATFLGYLVAGLPGAFLATVGIFLPSFVFVGLLTRITSRLRSSAWTAAVLDGLNAASLALMAGVSWQLARASVTDVWGVAIFAVTLVLLWRTRLNSAWYVAGGAVVGIGLGLSGFQWT